MEPKHFLPSWQNRFLSRIRSGRIHPYFWYVLIFLVVTLLIHLGIWSESDWEWGQLDYNLFNFLVWYLYIFFSFNYILDYASNAVIRFKPIVDLDQEEFQVLELHFTTIPAVAGWIITGVALVFSILAYEVMFPAEHLLSGVTRLIIVLVSTFLLSFAFALAYLLIKQVVKVSQLYKTVKNINIFHLSSLYVFSKLTAQIGIITILAGLLAYLTNVTFVSGEVQYTNFIFFGALFFTTALASFFLPAMGIHHRLEDEKILASNENDERINKVFQSLHDHVDGSSDIELGDLKDQLSALLTFREEIEKVSTWPWDPGTLRGFLSALFLPILLWLLETILSNLVGT